MIARVAATLLAASLGGCAWFDAGPPDRSCRTDRDCFRAQHEICVQTTHLCEFAETDAAIPIDAPLPLDAVDQIPPAIGGGAR